MAQVDSSDEMGPMGINYLRIYYHDLEGMEALSICLLILWIAMLTNLLGNTASNYFSPCLASICAKLYLSYDIAGVTFLAFGNGAPDVFSSLTSFSGGADVLIGVGALLGGSVFITTIVVGSICILSPCQVSPKPFIRDITFHIVAASVLTGIVLFGAVNLFMALSLFLIYVMYAITVCASTFRGNDTNVDFSVSSGAQVQTAFWYRSTRPLSNSTKSAPKSLAPQPKSGEYKFLILDESLRGRGHDIDDDDDDTVTINLTGGLMSPEFDGEIIEDYFSATTTAARAGRGLRVTREDNLVEEGLGRAGGMRRPPAPFDGVVTGEGEELQWNASSSSSFDTSGASLEESLLPHSSPSTPSTPWSAMGSAGTSGPGAGARAGDGSGGGRYGSTVQSLYWRQLLLRRRLRRSIMSAEWWQYPLPNKLLALVEFPAALARDLTIPTVDEEMWSKFHAVAQPISAPLFVLFLSGNFMGHWGSLPLAGVTVLISLVPALVIFLVTHHSHPPRSKVFAALWVLFSFFMCVSWVYLLAGELVACLTAVGSIFQIPPIYLGLTVLAWGNSIGDFFSNIAIARRGLGAMAIAGCYGGPIFNILIGLGISLTYACTMAYPKPFEIKLESSSIVSLVFLYFALLSTLVAVPLNGFRLSVQFGYCLIALYVLHTVTQGIFLVNGVK